MTNDNWQKQTKDQPLHPDLIWSRPTNMQTAGKLLIIGGNANGFKDPAATYAQAKAAGVGQIKVLIPDSLKKIIGRQIEEAEFAPSNKSGSFAKQSLATFLDLAAWADGTILAGDLSSNSETIAMLENFADMYKGILCFSQDAMDLAVNNPHIIISRPNSLIALDFDKLQKLLVNSHFPRALKSTMSIDNYGEVLIEYSKRYQPIIVSQFNDNIVVVGNGKITTTRTTDKIDISHLAVKSTIWWLQNPNKPIPAISSAVIN